MKKFTLLTIALLISFGASKAAAQFNIKIPKINKPKVEQPKTDGGSTNTTTDTNSNQNSGLKSKNSVGFMEKPRGTSVPVLLKDSINIKTYTDNNYWKTPNEQNHSSWIPLIQFGFLQTKANDSITRSHGSILTARSGSASRLKIGKPVIRARFSTPKRLMPPELTAFVW